MKVLLRVPLSPYLGYGNDGIGLARAFMRWGADVYLDPVNVQAPLPLDVARLLTKSLEPPFDLTIVHLDPGALSLMEEQKQASKLAIAWTMWEYSNFSNLPGRSNLKKNLQHFDAAVGYDDVTVKCFEPYFKKPILTVQGGFWPEDWPVAERDWYSDRWGFAMVGQLHMRKDPFVAIQAFQELKNDPKVEFEGAELHLKTQVPGLHRAMEQVIPKLRIHYAMWSNEILYQFYASQHVLLAPSRGEGKNMPALEMQSTGGTVIATNWGGHTQWLNPAYNYPLDYTLHPSDDAGSKALNARASVAHMKELMLHSYQNREEVRRKAELASQIIPKLCSWDAVIERLLLQLKDKVDGGEALWTRAQMCRQDRSDD